MFAGPTTPAYRRLTHHVQAREADAIVEYMRKLAKQFGGAGAAASAGAGAVSGRAAAGGEDRAAPVRRPDPTPTPEPGGSNDPCVDNAHTAANYAACCANGNVHKPGHREPCMEARNSERQREL